MQTAGISLILTDYFRAVIFHLYQSRESEVWSIMVGEDKYTGPRGRYCLD